jgi:hypothetical protein
MNIVRPDGQPAKPTEAEAREKVMEIRKLHAQKLADAQVNHMPIGDRDVIIITTPEDFSKQEIGIILKLVMESNPKWDGPVICLDQGQTFEKMKEETARKFWAILNRKFGTKSGDFKALRALVKMGGEEPSEEQLHDTFQALRKFVGEL